MKSHVIKDSQILAILRCYNGYEETHLIELEGQPIEDYAYHIFNTKERVCEIKFIMPSFDYSNVLYRHHKI